MANTSRAGALRRYPALAYLAGAVALALLLPSGLNVPNSGPSSLAEYAPVPGQSNAPSDLAQVGQASSSGGPGFGGGGQGGGGGPTTVPGAPDQAARGIVRKAGNKRCVGSPPRQTEDPLSPPCVAIFEGDNFGATAKGVTRDEIRVVVFAQNSTGSTSPFDCGGTITASNVTDEVACHAYQAFFNNRYQMYGRRPHIIIFRFIGGNIEASVAEADARFSPFAMIVTEPNGSTADAQSASRGTTSRVRLESVSRKSRVRPSSAEA